MDQRLVMVGLDPDLAFSISRSSSRGTTLLGYFDYKNCESPLAHYLGEDSRIPEFLDSNPRARLVVGTDRMAVRSRIANDFKDYLGTWISGTVDLGTSAVVWEGCTIQTLTYIGPRVNLGIMVKVNVGASIHHDAIIGNCTVVAPAAKILGSAVIGEAVLVGAGSVVLPGVQVGDRAVIGAGAVVTKDVQPSATVVGVPARVIDHGLG